MLELGIKELEEATMGKFVVGLNDDIKDKLLIDQAATYDDA